MRSVVGLLAVLLFAVGCGIAEKEAASPPSSPSASVGSPSPSTSATPSVDAVAELRAAVQAYSDAFLKGEANAAYAMLSKRCRDRVARAEWSDIVEQAKQTYGSALPIKTFDAQVSGDMARVTYTFDLAAINQDAEPWVREGGSWREDDC